MRIAKKLVALLLAIAVVGPVMGCSGGVGTSVADIRRSVRRVADYDARMLVDDIALFTQTDRTLRTSRWIID